MICLDCKHGKPENGKVTIAFERNGTTVVLKDVPALVCPICGTYYTTEETTDIILKLGNDAVEKGAEIEVLRVKAA